MNITHFILEMSFVRCSTLESSRSHDDNQTEPVLPAVLPSDDSRSDL